MGKNTVISTKSKKYQIYNINKYKLLDFTKDKINTKNSRSIIIIPNLCNTNYIYGGTHCNSIATYYPIVEQSYNVLGKVFVNNNPGYVQFIDVLQNNDNKLIIANMLAQTGVTNQIKTRTINYNYLVDSMLKIKHMILQLQKKYIDEHIDISIHSYKFGANKSANGNWNFIINLIEDIWLPHTNINIHEK